MASLAETLRLLLAECAGVPADLLHPERRFTDQGLGAAELAIYAHRIEEQFGRAPPNLLWDCVSIADLARNLTGPEPSDSPMPVAERLGFIPGLPDATYYE